MAIMAAHVVAAAWCSNGLCFVLMFFVHVLCTFGRSDHTYSRNELLKIGLRYEGRVTGEFIRLHEIPLEIARSPGPSWFPIPSRGTRRRRRRRKRGRRAGALARLRRLPLKPPLPSLFLSNARSLLNKMDELRLQVATDNCVKDVCALLITETWLQHSVPDSAIELAGYTALRRDRTADSGKSRGGGVCVYVNNSWCTNTVTIDSQCSPDIEYLTVKCRPFYLPREFTAVMVTAVYIPPDANANSAMEILHARISNQQSQYPDAVQIIAGDFNHADLKTSLPKFYQHVKCATRGNNTLDKVYSNVKMGYRARPQPHLGLSDHLSLLLIPAYVPVRKTAPILTRTVPTWPDDASQRLQDCFERTDWEVFEHQDLENFTDSVLCYIKNCVETVTVNKLIRVYPNQKPWMTQEVKQLLRKRNTAHKSGDKDLYSAARTNLRRGIRKAKADYRRKIEHHLDSNDNRQVWQGVQQLTNYRTNLGAAEGDITLAEDLNIFFARFDVTTQQAPQLHPTAHNSTVLVLDEHEVRRTLRAVNPRKAAGPDGVPGRVLRDCADQLTPVFTKIFNRSLAQSTVPVCLKSSIIVPLPKKPHVSSFNDYRPVALTPTVMKCFEKLVRRHITAALPPGLDPHQFLYRENRSTEDAIATALHAALSHLEQRGSYVRMLFVDHSSAFNTILPHKLVAKLEDLGLPSSTCLWISSFLSGRRQRVRVDIVHPRHSASVPAPPRVVY
ncbi:uncharacterized protein LOC112142095 [Oryzias melastigma]|uniref:uncharacterized protein LOC112142095 n=1 Tax=Oryzias melastigma TaxID=30732 RepID=UPI000CF7DFEE|nr:uncharacterized protein LOC112142095 [Oryzias melastigma]